MREIIPLVLEEVAVSRESCNMLILPLLFVDAMRLKVLKLTLKNALRFSYCEGELILNKLSCEVAFLACFLDLIKSLSSKFL